MKVFDTSGFVRELYAGTFSREAFLSRAQESGATELHVDTRFFPERAMYWTRMLRNAAAEKGMALTTLSMDSALIAPDETVEAQRANLSEWIRIAALSKINHLEIHVDGQPGMPEAPVRLACALEPLAPIARQYGVTLVLSDGGAELGDEALLCAAKALGYTGFRVRPRAPLSQTDAPWAV